MIRARPRVFEAGLVHRMQLSMAPRIVGCLNALGDRGVAGALMPPGAVMTLLGAL